MRDAGTDWQQWLAAHAPAALLYARQFAGSPQDAEDALHDGFVRFWEKCASARDPVAFLYVCIRSAALIAGAAIGGGFGAMRRPVARLPQFAPPDPGDFARQEMVEAALAQPAPGPARNRGPENLGGTDVPANCRDVERIHQHRGGTLSLRHGKIIRDPFAGG